MHGRTGRAAVAVALALLGSCAVEPVETEEVTSAAGPGGPCQEEICGSNSPEVDSLGFHELNTTGIPNLEGFVIETRGGVAQIVKGLSTYNLRVVGGVISGTQFPFGISGSQLVGAYIPIKNVRTGRQYHLVIRGVSTMSYFVPPTSPAPPPFEAYTLTWRAPPQDYERSLCNNIDGLHELQRDDYEQAYLELMGLDVLQSVVFEGDRIFTQSKTMAKLADDSWINIGCAGHTLAKLFLTRNTVHSQRAGIPRAWEQRQATFKMLVADYCGTGQPFTSFGEKVVWKGDLMPFFSTPVTLEARWNERGAMCLHVPRLEDPSTQLGKDLFPDVKKQIRDACSIAGCLNIDPQDFARADRVSGNPL